MRVLVIGGTGLIGAPLVRHLLQAGHAVAVFHRGNPAELPAEATHIVGDRKKLALHAEELRRFKPDVVVDLILSSGKRAEELMRTFRGIARQAVAPTSMDVYRAAGVLHGTEPGPLEPLPLTEESPLRQNRQVYPPEQLKILQGVFPWLDDEYDKIAVEEVVLNDPELPATVLRLPMIYGPGDRLHRLFPLLKRMDDGRPRIVFSDDLAAWRSPRGYSENVAAAIALAAGAKRALGRVYNVCEEETFSELEWAKKVAALAGWKGEFVVVPRDQAPRHLRTPGNLAQHWVGSSQRIRDELGYREPVSRDKALKKTIAWERENFPRINPLLFDYEAEDRAVAA